MNIIPNKERRTAIARMETVLKDVPQLDLPPEHHFAPGIYVRELFMPADTFIVSKLHKTTHFAVALSGRVLVCQEDGTRVITGPQLLLTKAGTKRALYVLEDAVWLTFHPTEKTDVNEIEAELIAKDFAQLVGVES